MIRVNPGPAEPRYALPLQTVKIQISWLLDLNYLSISIIVSTTWIELSDWLKISSGRDSNLFSMARVNERVKFCDPS